MSSPAPAPSAPAAPTQYPAYEGHGLKVTIAAKRDATNATIVNLTASFSSASGPISAINFQAAVPKVRSSLLVVVDVEMTILRTDAEIANETDLIG